MTRFAIALAKNNNKVSVIDFQQWVQDQIEILEGDHVLDVGCGTGAQSLRYLDRVCDKGSVYAIDAMKSSINQLIEKTKLPNLIAQVGDMMNLSNIITENNPSCAIKRGVDNNIPAQAFLE